MVPDLLITVHAQAARWRAVVLLAIRGNDLQMSAKPVTLVTCN